MTDPFAYPPAAHARRHGPRGYADPESYRPWLRDEFTFRCVYCLLREQWCRVGGTFDVEHFKPTATHPERSTDYDNLQYACTTCNAAKGKQEVPDPGATLLADPVLVHPNGAIEGLTPAARRTIRVLGLDSPAAREFRLMWTGIVAWAERHDPALLARLMGDPDDLPDLSRLRPPRGNTRPEGVRQSSHARRAAGQLPDTY
jgi:hypothetical protein